MSYPIDYPTPQNCNIQIFYGTRKAATGFAAVHVYDWVKPKGASFVWFTLIGSGGAGGNSDGVNNQGGGGSGAVTNCLMPAFLVPDQLRVRTDLSANLFVMYHGSRLSTGYDVLSAAPGNSGSSLTAGSGAAASTKTPFAVAGLYQSVGGHSSTFGVNVTSSIITFLSAGASNGFTVQPNYGYPTSATADGAGFFQTLPILVGRGGNTASDGNGITGGIGCGGGGASSVVGALGGRGGQSMAIIISW